MSNDLKNVTLSAVIKKGSLEKPFLDALMKDPTKALAKENLALTTDDMEKLITLIEKTKRVSSKELKDLMNYAKSLGLAGGGPDPGVFPPGWPWPAEWVDFNIQITGGKIDLGEPRVIDPIDQGTQKPKQAS